MSDLRENALGLFSCSQVSSRPRPSQADYNALSAKQRVAMTHEFLADVEVLRKAVVLFRVDVEGVVDLF